jgi:mono/diheme cytochrome c family protein
MQQSALRSALLLGAVSWLFAMPAYGADAEKGKGAYDSRCAFCHGKSGKGDGPAGKALKPPPPDFTSATFWKGTTSDHIEDVIEHGKPNSAMMGFKGSLTSEQIADLVAYLETLKPKP